MNMSKYVNVKKLFLVVRGILLYNPQGVQLEKMNYWMNYKNRNKLDKPLPKQI